VKFRTTKPVAHCAVIALRDGELVRRVYLGGHVA